MTVWEVILIGFALAMDAVAVGMTDGMLEPEMRPAKMFAIAGAFGFFQFFMPVLGYGFGAAFAEIVGKIAPYLSFALLGLIGGKMIIDGVRELRHGGEEKRERERLGAGKILLQAVATSIDALAVGVTLLAAETSRGLPFHAVFCAVVIGAVTLLLCVAAVFLGRKIGNKLSDKAELVGGAILIAIGIRLLIAG